MIFDYSLAGLVTCRTPVIYLTYALLSARAV